MSKNQLEVLRQEISSGKMQSITKLDLPMRKLVLRGLPVETAERVLDSDEPCAIKGSKSSNNL